MASRTNRVLLGVTVGVTPGIALWVIGALLGGEALLSFGVIGILVSIVGMVIGGVVGAGAPGSGTGTGSSKAAIGAMIGCIPGLVLLFFMTRVGVPIILVGGLIGAFVGGRIGAGGGTPTTVH